MSITNKQTCILLINTLPVFINFDTPKRYNFDIGDFVVTKHHEVEALIQVCFELTPDNSSREERGLIDAMNYFNKNSGTIITFNQQDEIRRDGKQIHVVPAYQYLREK